MENGLENSASKKQLLKDILLILLIIFVVDLGFHFSDNPLVNLNITEKTNLEDSKKLTAAVLPKTGDLFIYNIYFNEAGYQELLKAEKFIKLDNNFYKEKLIGLDVWIPCCDFPSLQGDYSQNCQCGHHLALYGAAKILAKSGKSRSDTQDGINKWRAYFFPQDSDKFNVTNLESRGNC